MDYITAFSDGLQLLLNNRKSNFISPAIQEATDRQRMIQIELALIISIKCFSLHPKHARTHGNKTQIAQTIVYLTWKNRPLSIKSTELLKF